MKNMLLKRDTISIQSKFSFDEKNVKEAVSLPIADENNYFVPFTFLSRLPCCSADNLKHFDQEAVEGWMSKEEYAILEKQICSKTRFYSVLYHCLNFAILIPIILLIICITIINQGPHPTAHFLGLTSFGLIGLTLFSRSFLIWKLVKPGMKDAIDKHLIEVNEEYFHKRGVHIGRGDEWLLINIEYGENNYKPPKYIEQDELQNYLFKSRSSTAASSLHDETEENLA